MRSTLTAISILLASDLAAADERSDVPPEASARPVDLPGWRLELQPYALLPAKTTGSVAVRNMEVPIDVTLSDLASSLQFVAQVRFEAWNHRFGLIVDNSYSQLGTTRETQRDLGLNLSTRTWVGKLLIGYLPVVTRWVSLEVDAGVRLSWLSGRLTAGMTTFDARDMTASGVVGARIPVRLSRQWALVARGEIVIPDDWTVAGGADWDFSRMWTLRLSYSVTHTESGGDPDVKLTSHGPYIGLGFRFGAGPIY